VEGNCAEIALVENLLRQDLTAVEEAEALQRLKEDQKYTDEQLSGVIGKARTTISDIMAINRLPLEIRDECRGDRKITKTVLIDIARKKQVRGMQTAYEKYKEKVKKAAEGRTKHEKNPETAGAVMTWLSKAVGKLQNIDASAWTEDEKNTFNQTLMELQETIRKILNPSEADNAV
jgi:ParB family chromosome partitioning protein